MKDPPKDLGKCELLRWSPIDNRHRPTGNCAQIVGGEVQGPAAGLAICADKSGYLLFGCDSAWNVVTDTWHQTLEEAMSQAEFEYEGVSATWNTA